MTRSHIERDVLFRKLIEQVSKGKFDQQQVLAELCWAVVDLSAKVEALSANARPSQEDRDADKPPRSPA